MRHPETRGFTPDQQAIYDEWLWLLTHWGTHTADEAHELALLRATDSASHATAQGVDDDGRQATSIPTWR